MLCFVEILFSYNAFSYQTISWSLNYKKLLLWSLEPEQETFQLAELYRYIYIRIYEIFLNWWTMFYESKIYMKKSLQRSNAFLLSGLFDVRTLYGRNFRTKNCTSQRWIVCGSLYSFGPLNFCHILWNWFWFAAGWEQVGVRMPN